MFEHAGDLQQFSVDGLPVESVLMKSLYGLLDAHEDDDADALKKAFRRAIKAHHPDLHPGDPDAVERFRQIVAANALLRDATQRATYDRLLRLQRQQFQLKVERHQVRSKLAHRQVRLKRMRATAAVAAVGALVGGYGLFSHMTTTPVTVSKDGQAASAVAIAKKDRQAAFAIVAAESNENTPPAAAAPKLGVVGKDNLESNADNAGVPVETTGAQVLQATGTLDQREPGDKHENALVANGQSNGREATSARPANDGNFYRERAIAAYSSGDLLGAIGNFDESIRLNPADAQSYDIRGNVWDELGMFERALADYDEAIRIDPNNPAVFHDRAILWQRQGALDRALVDLDRAIRFSFDDANLYCDRGLIWYQKGRHGRAIADFDRAIKLDSGFAAAYINRGLILHRNRPFNIAVADSKAIRVDPRIFDVSRHMSSPH
jgi:tetratricopeptide (TPR) repeat protein